MNESLEMKVELVPVAVTDVDRAIAFYVGKVGFTLDVDVRPTSTMRVVQLTPPGSACSIGMGHGAPMYDQVTPGALQNLHLVVADIDRAREVLIGRGVDVSSVVDVGGGVKYAWFGDPDGNTMALQEMPWRKGDSY